MYNPRTAKLRFNFRLFNNCVFVGAITIIFLFIFARFDWYWIADLALMGALFYFYFFILQNRPIKLHCPHCEKIIRSNTPWVCGFCKESNRNANEYSFVDKCGHCKDEPKAYKCHHCGEMIYLSDDEDKINYAYALNSPVEIPQLDERAIKRQAHEGKKEDKINAIEAAELDLKLKQIKERKKGPKLKTPYEQKQELCEKDYVGIMGVVEYVRRKTIEVEKLYKNDPESLKKALEAIKEIESRHM